MSNKIFCIQWCRAIAIFAVVAFHIFPKYFPNGFLGVDMFFVISGYLIFSIVNNLLKENTIQDVLWIFYSRRFKRIFPNYFLTIFYIMIAGFLIFQTSDFEYLQEDAIWATLFGTNIKPIVAEQNYFRMTSSFKSLLHTWSLAVEIQFYIIAPALVYFSHLLNFQNYFWFTLILASFFSQIYYLNSPIGFNFMFCRLWQFCVGAMVCCCQNNKSNKYFYQKHNTIKIGFLYGLILLMLFLWYPIGNLKFNLDRLIVTVISSLLVYHKNLPNEIGEKAWSKFLVHVGDASYSIYLAHWPIIIFCRYLYMDGVYAISLMITLIIIFSLIQQLYFEIPMQNYSKMTNCLISLILIIGIFLMVFLPSPSPKNDFSRLSNNLTVSEASNYNQRLHQLCKKFSVPCGKNLLLKQYFPWNQGYNPMHAKCVLNDPKNGKKVAVLAGNSFMSRQANAIIKALKASEHGRQFGTIYVLTQQRCPIFESAFDEKNKKKCLGLMKSSLLNFLKEVKPDLFVSLNRLEFLNQFSSALPANLKIENQTTKLANDLQSYANLSKTLLVIQPHFVVETSDEFAEMQIASALTLSHKLAKNQDITNLTKTKQEIDLQLTPSWTRMKTAATFCKNCHIFEFLDLFCNEKFCDLYDKKNNLAYFCDNYHFTDYAASKFIPHLTKMFNKILF